jgi:fumarate reductase flavoprotein subunit
MSGEAEIESDKIKKSNLTDQEWQRLHDKTALLGSSSIFIDDTPQLHYDDIMRISKGHANPELVRLAVNAAAPAFDWLLANGFKVRDGHPITGTTHEPYSRARYAWGQNGGRSILEVLNAQLAPHIESGRVIALVGHSAVDLTRDSRGAILGVVTRGPDGRKTSHRGRKVALTAGGYTANPVMYEKYEGIRTFTRATYPFSQGQGIELGLSVGGLVRGGEYHTPLFGAVLEYEEYPSAIRAMVRHFPPERPPYEILVARDGKRFLREDIPSHDAHEHAKHAAVTRRAKRDAATGQLALFSEA